MTDTTPYPALMLIGVALLLAGCRHEKIEWTYVPGTGDDSGMWGSDGECGYRASSFEGENSAFRIVCTNGHAAELLTHLTGQVWSQVGQHVFFSGDGCGYTVENHEDGSSYLGIGCYGGRAFGFVKIMDAQQ